MSIVIIGGNERMVCQYTDICKDYGYKAKVFPKENGAIRKKIGCPDLMVLFTNTVSHKMVISASQEAKKNNIPGGGVVCGIPKYISSLCYGKHSWLLCVQMVGQG